MKKIQKDRRPIRFSSPDPITSSITVSRVLSDKSSEPIGKIYPDFGNGEDSAMYVSTDSLGNALFPPTSDFVDLESRFERYAKELPERLLAEDMNGGAKGFGEREESIKGLRRWGFNLKTKLISR
jgi:hypothetical protein